jgi:hypothetical protein
MTAKGYLIVAGLLLAGGAGLGWWARGGGKNQSAALAQAAQQDQTAAAADTQGAQHGQEAQVAAQAVTTDKAAVADKDAKLAQLQAEVIRLRQLQPGVVRPAGAPGAAAADALPVPVGAALDAAKDQLISAEDADRGVLKQDLADTTTQLAATQAEDASHQQAEAGYKAEAATLRGAIEPPRPMAVGLIIGTSQTIGAFVERDLGPIRAGVDVVRHVLPTGPATIDATARLGWRF